MRLMVDLPEAELLQAACEGDRGAWNRLMEDHYPAVLALSHRMLGDDSEARDAALAGVREYWVVDGRREEVDFALYNRAPDRYEVARPDPEGFRSSALLGRGVKIRRIPIGSGLIRYDLEFR